MYPKIIGLDESGKLGDPFIIFSQVEFYEESEADLFIHNIFNTGNLFLVRNRVKGWDKSTKVKFCLGLLENRLINVKFYKLNLFELNKMLKDIFKHQADALFEVRNRLIKTFDTKNSSSFISHLIAQLYHYRKFHYLPEFYIKSYGFLFISKKICESKLTCDFLKNEDNLIKIQIDGGNIFSFWWYHLLKSINNNELFENKLFINGIPHGDQYYLSMNLADILSHTYREKCECFFDYPIQDITYNFNEIDFSEDIYFEHIWEFLKNYTFRNRLLLVGESELFNLIPHLLHFKKRSVIYEPFRIKDDINDYFKYFKIGAKEKNLVIHSNKLNKIEKENLNVCKEIGLEIKSVQEFKDDYSDFYDNLNTSLDFYDSKTQTKVKSILKKYKSLF